MAPALSEAPMARKRTGGKTGGKPPRVHDYVTTKADRETVRRAGELARAEGIATGALVERILAPVINQMWVDYLARQAAQLNEAKATPQPD